VSGKRKIGAISLVIGLSALGAAPAWSGPEATSAQRPVKRVLVKDDFFSPKRVTIAPGTKVTWLVKGVDGHTVTFRKVPKSVGHIKGTGIMLEGEHYSHVFRKKGTYRYVCRLHEALGMKGTVVVR
jgi:plastocyanin